MPTFLEFFAGGGMARAGLGPGWDALFANDIDPKKSAAYAANGRSDHFLLRDIAVLTAANLPGRADLAWASFPCQDLSLAGKGRGLEGGRSGTFWPFVRLISDLKRESRAPALIALENVCGLLTSRGGADFTAVVGALAALGYRVGAMVIDAARFAPQSRPRLFFLGVADGCVAPESLAGDRPPDWTATKALIAAHARLPRDLAARWLWWAPPEPPSRNQRLIDLIEPDAAVAAWRTDDETAYLLSLMAPANRAKVAEAVESGERRVGAVYRRTRRDEAGKRIQRAEIRFDGLAGCLRTPAGGSSRQTILIVDGKSIRSRLLTPRECARLMGLADDYRLPARANDAYHVAGDGVAAPVVRHLAAHLFEPILAAQGPARLAAE